MAPPSLEHWLIALLTLTEMADTGSMDEPNMALLIGVFFFSGFLFGHIFWLLGWGIVAVATSTCFWFPLRSAFARFALLGLATAAGVFLGLGTLSGQAAQWATRALLYYFGLATIVYLVVLAIRAASALYPRAA